MKRLLKIIIIAFLSVSLISILKSCKKISLPDVTTANVSEISATSAVSGGNVTNNGGAEVSSRGICWGSSQKPDINSSKTTDGTGNGSFSSNMTDLTPNTTYYIRAYATNSEGTVYGNEENFETDPATLEDIEGNRYNLVRIGTQLWMKENLKTTKYNDGSTIRIAITPTEWQLKTAAFCWLDNDTWNKDIYGALYKWYTVNTGKLCPTGWHVPSDAEWKILERYLGMTQEEADATGWRGTDQGTQLKSTSSWASGVTGDNASGFSALPGSWRDYDCQFMNYIGSGKNGFWWSTTEYDAETSWARGMDYNSTRIIRRTYWLNLGYSVRCVRDK